MRTAGLLYFHTPSKKIWLLLEQDRGTGEISLDSGARFEPMKRISGDESDDVVWEHKGETYRTSSQPPEGQVKPPGVMLFLNDDPLTYSPGGVGRARK